MIEHARRLACLAPNIAIKVPATPAGIIAIEELAALGVRTNATVCFTVSQAIACAEAAERGLERARQRTRGSANGDSKAPATNRRSKAVLAAPDSARPWVTIMVGRLDDHLKQVMDRDRISIQPGWLDWAGIAVFKRAHTLFRARNYQSTLLAAAYRNHLHWSELIGPGVVLWMPYRWWTQFERSNIEPRRSLTEPVDPQILAALSDHFADFRAAYDDAGLSPSAFIDYRPTIHTLQQFHAGLDKLVQFVRSRRLR